MNSGKVLITHDTNRKHDILPVTLFTLVWRFDWAINYSTRTPSIDWQRIKWNKAARSPTHLSQIIKTVAGRGHSPEACRPMAELWYGGLCEGGPNQLIQVPASIPLIDFINKVTLRGEVTIYAFVCRVKSLTGAHKRCN